jgi:hypothetical protein
LPRQQPHRQGITVQFGVLQLGILQFSVLHFGILQLGVLQLGVLQLGVLQLGVLQLGVLQFGVLQLSRLWLVGSFGLNFQADYGCLALKEPFLSLETSLPPKAFLALNSQADYGCLSRSHFLLKPILAATLSREPFFLLRDDH